MSLLQKILGDSNKKVLSTLRREADRITALEESIRVLSDDDLRAKTQTFKDRLSQGETLDALLPEAFATVREAAHRVLGQRLFDVQLMGGIVLHRGGIPEMRTGEGKTLTAVAPLYLNALTGEGCHLVTVNDYLARRDAAWMGRVFHALGLTVGCIQHAGGFVFDPAFRQEEAPPEDVSVMNAEAQISSFRVQTDFLRPVSRREAYHADITYGTNNEFGFDYLRDNMAPTLGHTVQRALHFAIVDEADSILIDEARTPLIISAPAEESTDLYQRFTQIMRTLQEGRDYNVDEKMRAVTFTEQGLHAVEQALGLANLYADGTLEMIHHADCALKAHALYRIDRDYVVREGEVVIVDEFTGRLMPGRRYSEGLHQAIEAKEGVTVQRESRTLATITFQNLFRLYKKLSGMTGTAATEAEEFSKTYGLDVTVIPTHRGNAREDLSDRVYPTEIGKFMAVVKQIQELQAKGVPVLVGTVSIEKNEVLSGLLQSAGVKHEVLNAKNHEREAEIIAQAGRPGSVTIATNMAGRGVDIVLGGNPPEPGAAEAAKEQGGLFVIGTERHESRRIDNQLRGRSGRQGDPGKTQFCLSMEDDLMRIFGSERVRGLMRSLKIPEDEPIENGMVSRAIEKAQHRVEGFHFDTRKHLLEYDDVLNKHREVVYSRRRELLIALEKRDAAFVEDRFFEILEEEIEQLVLFHTEGKVTLPDSAPEDGDWNPKEIEESLGALLSLSPEKQQEIRAFMENLDGDKKISASARSAFIEMVLQEARGEYASLKTQAQNSGFEAFQLLGQLMMRCLDRLWMDHLSAMDALRAGINLRGWGQRDPLSEYKKEGFGLFSRFLTAVGQEIAGNGLKALREFANARVSSAAPPPLLTTPVPQAMLFSGAPKGEEPAPTAPVSSSAASPEGSSKIGRNDPCPCGSGKKYKKCHGG